MANNGGTLNGVPQSEQRLINNSCNSCNLSFDSSESLNVHVHYHHNNNSESSLNRWNSNSSSAAVSQTSNSPTDSENNNQPKHQVKSGSDNFTISAAADSSDNQPSTPLSTASGDNSNRIDSHHNRHHHITQGFNTNLNHLPTHYQHLQSNEMHYPSYMSNYDQYYHHQHSMEYGLPPPPPTHYLNNSSETPAFLLRTTAAANYGQRKPTVEEYNTAVDGQPTPSQQEYKTVPSSNRFHPYNPIANNLPAYSSSNSHNNHVHQSQQASGAAVTSIPATVSVAQNSISPNVTSSSPIQNNLMHSTVPSQIGQPTPSPSPKHCDKCGFVCETIAQLNEHQANAHNARRNKSSDGSASINRNSGNGDIENDIPTFQYSQYGQTKEEPAQQQPADCDILDLDSQKMVYPPHEVNQQSLPLPPMHSLHPMQRHPMIWSSHSNHESQTFLPIPPTANPNDLKSPMFTSLKSEFSPQILKQEHLNASTNSNSTSQSDLQKSFGNDGNQVTTSPSEFPSTTTPQENGSQYRSTFEAATSSLPNGGPLIKATSWKSNEARRPKTYNCTACNKWFTSSGHLKRHYNTTLHKNAVKSSGQPDPATLPISVHHHPARDPTTKSRYNSKSAHNNSIAQQQQNSNQQNQSQANTNLQSQSQTVLPNETSRTPDYSSQFTPFAGPQSQSPNPITFQQFSAQNPMQSNIGTMHPNALAGLYDNSFQSRDLLIYSNIMEASHQHNSNQRHIQELHQRQSIQDFIQTPQIQQISLESMHNLNSMEQHCNITTPITINTHITQSYHIQRQPDMNYTIIGNPHQPHQQLANNVISTSTGNNDNSQHSTYYGSENGTILVSTSSTASSNLSPNNSIQSQYNNNNNNNSSIHVKSEYNNYDDDDDDDEQQQHNQSHHYNNDYEAKQIKHFSNTNTTIPAIVALRRLNNDIYHADTVPPFSPDIPDKRITYNNRAFTPQTGEIVPTNLSPNAPQQHHYSNDDMQLNEVTIKNEPSSPSISSTNSSIGVEQASMPNESNTNSKPKIKSNKRRSAIDTAKLITDTIPVGNDPLRCAPCDKVFNKACYLTQHNKTFHSGDKPFKCQRCGKRFPCGQSHDEHMQKHLGNKPFKCDQCTKQFNHKTDLRRHMCLHTGTKPYTCEICNKGFIRKDHKVKHGLTHLKRKNSESSSTSSIQNVHPNTKSTKNIDEQLQLTSQMEDLEPGKQINSNNKSKKRNANNNLNNKKRKVLVQVTTS